VIDALRRLAARPPLRRVLTHPLVEPFVATVLRASPVRGRARFLVRERSARGETRTYRLRASGAIVHVRHATPDVAALGEVFYEHQYEPPTRVAEALEQATGPLRILDLGANVGFFALFASARWPGSRVVTVEPDPANLELLARTRVANGLDWEVVEAAATTFDGEVPFAAGAFTVSRIEEGGTPVRAVDALGLLAAADLAKVDIEGAEWALLTNERFPRSAPRALVLEYHPYLAPPGADAQGLLVEAGYSVESSLDFSAGHGLLWALR
jgi:FkbM family methyltransferase